MLNVYCDAAFCPNLRVGVGAWVYIDPMTQELVKEYDILLYPPTLNVDANYCEYIALKRAMTSVTTSIVLPSGATFHTDSEHSIRECASEGFYKESSKVAVAKATRAQVDQAHRYANEVLEHFRNTNYVVCDLCLKTKPNVKVDCGHCGGKSYTIQPVESVIPDVRYTQEFKISLKYSSYLTVPSKTSMLLKLEDTLRNTHSGAKIIVPLNDPDSRKDAALAAASLLYSAITEGKGSDLAAHILSIESDEPEIGSGDIYVDYLG